MSHPPDMPPRHWLETALKWLDEGFHVHQKWDCVYCGSRQTMDQANRYFTKGVCEVCTQVSDIPKAGLFASNKPCITLKDDLPSPPLPRLLLVKAD